MPLYEYRCPNCKETFEQLVSFAKADEVSCRYCKHEYVQRQISRVAVRTSGTSGSVSYASDSCSTGGG